MSPPAPSSLSRFARLAALERTWLQCLEAHGYERVYVPTLAPLAGYADRLGEDLRSEYLTLVLGDELVLRPEFTSGVCRLVLEAAPQAAPPGAAALRLHYCGQTYRVQRTTGLFPHERRQLGAELVGLAAPAGDAEMLRLLAALAEAAAIPGLTLSLGHAALFGAVLTARGASPAHVARVRRDLLRLKNHGDRLRGGDAVLASVLPQRLEARMRRGGFALGAVPGAAADAPAEPERLIAFEAEVARAEWQAAGVPAAALDLVERRGEARGDFGHVEAWLGEAVGPKTAERLLRPIAEALAAAGLPPTATGARAAGGQAALTLQLDATAARDIAYYSGLLFELRAPGPAGALGGGGRYDGLYEALGGPAAARPAIGLALDLARVAALEPEAEARP